MLHTHHTFRSRPARLRAFTLIELMVTVSILLLITGIVMVRYSAFDSSILLNNQAYEIALDIRETQVRSISVQSRDAGDTGFASNFGIHFNESTPNQYILFQDNQSGSGASSLGIYNAAHDQAIGAPFSLDNRFRISDIQVNGTDVTAASVIFRRPNFDARIRSSPVVSSVTQLRITVASVRDSSATRTVVVYNSGQISVE